MMNIKPAILLKINFLSHTVYGKFLNFSNKEEKHKLS